MNIAFFGKSAQPVRAFLGRYDKFKVPKKPYDAEVKWLESTGMQYIDTGVFGRDGLLISAKATRDLYASTGVKYIFGGSQTALNVISIGINNSNGRCTCGLNSTMSTNTTDGVVSDNLLHDYAIDTTSGAKYAIANGVEIRTLNTSNSTVAQNSIRLFGFYLSSMLYASCRIQAFSIKDTRTNNYLIDLIPVRFTNELFESEGAMYDRVSGQLFRNQGTSKFVVGADAGMPYDAEVAYVEYHSVNFNSSFLMPFSESLQSRFSGKKMNEIDWSVRGTVSRIDSGGNMIGIGGGQTIGGVCPYMAGASNPPSIYASQSSLGSVVC